VAIVDRTRLDRIAVLARSIRVNTLALSLIAFPLVLAGSTAYCAVASVRWIAAAIATGYADARKRARAG
jgi:hypothetical protein